MEKLLKTILFIFILNNILFANEKLADYISFRYLTQDVDGFEKGTAFAINAGKDIGDSSIVTSTEFTSTITKATRGNEEISLYTLGGYIGYFFTVSENIYIIPNLGVLYESTKTTTKKDSTTGVTYGINFNYVLSRKVDILYEYKVIESKVNHSGFGIRHRF